MSTAEADGGVPSEVVDAIEQNPEAVAELLERSGQLGTLIDALALATDALDDRIVESLTADATTLGLAATALADDGTVELGGAVGANGAELAAAAERVAALERTGTLDRLFEVADALALVTDAADDEMVESVVSRGTALGEMATRAADDDVRRGLERLLDGVGDAAQGEPEPLGPLGLARALRDPEVQAGMGFLVAAARGVGSRTEGVNR
ncbi:DUF1641 domain-containing protein [Salinigranum halophilum]|uniref:DUF1641 domain-containing protein n=1 Tax=Salinigranum halophilum TaxID=2565931 RepID=UPI0010A869A8|nr:DUF1641 domain-containing protein [Salinigranum halophilum]